MKDRITPENIKSIEKNQIFVYGDNEAHIHGAGAAKQAMKFGAKYHKGGLVGRTYGIPTKSAKLTVLSLSKIQKHIDIFVGVSQFYPEKTFLVTAIGTGLSGYSAQDIAPLFKEAVKYDNIHLSQRFWDVLNKEK